MSKRWWAYLLSIALFAGSGSSFAQTDEQKASARSLATQGFEAFTAQRWADAADLFSRAESLVHSVTHLVYVARALEKQGKLVKARETYLKVTRETLDANAPPAAKQAQQDATSELAQLEPRIPMLQVTLENAPADAQVSVTIDGTPLPPALIGVQGPVDPGNHELVATAPGMQSGPVKVDVAEGSKQTATLRLEPASGAAPSSTPSDGATGSASTELDTGGMRPMMLTGFIALGVGVVGLGAGTFFAIQSSNKTSEWHDLCAGPEGTNSRPESSSPNRRAEERCRQCFNYRDRRVHCGRRRRRRGRDSARARCIEKIIRAGGDRAVSRPELARRDRALLSSPPGEELAACRTASSCSHTGPVLHPPRTGCRAGHGGFRLSARS